MFKYDFFLKTHIELYEDAGTTCSLGVHVRYVSMLNKVWEYFKKIMDLKKKVVEIRYFRHIAC